MGLPALRLVGALFRARRYLPIQMRENIRRRRKIRTPRTMPINSLKLYFGGSLGDGVAKSDEVGSDIPLAVVVTDTVSPIVLICPK